MIDWARVEELKTDMGADDFDEVIDLFLSEIETTLDGMGQSGSDTLAKDIHFLKGSAANVGFEQLCAMCRKSELAPNDVDISDIARCYFESKTIFLSELEARHA